ncbi:MAG: hypothetical protein V4638_02930 [Bacteroidota bacterium]
MKKILSFSLLFVLLVACGKKENKSIESYLSSFIGQNEAVSLFGKVQLKSILEKGEYSKIPIFGVLAQGELNGMKNEINVDAPIYFALEGPFSEDGIPASSYVFAEVKNADSLAANLKQRGFDLEEKDGIKMASSGDVAIGFQNNLFILVSKADEFDGNDLLAKAFEAVYEDEAGGHVNSILKGKGDIVYGVSIANLVNSSNTELKNLPKDKLKAFEQLVNNSFVAGSIKLENGSATFQTNNLFSPDLKKSMFLKEDNSAAIRALLGTGQPRLGVSLNIDMKKMQSFLNTYAPNALNELSEEIGGPMEMALLTAGDDGLAGLFNGQLGMVMMGDPSADGTFTPNFNVHVGLEKTGQTLAQTFQGFLQRGMAQVDLTEKGLSAYSNANYLPKQGAMISVPQGCESFGKKGICLFANLDGLNLENFELEGAQKLLNIVKYASIEVDNNGVKIYLKAKDDNANIVKQVVTYLMQELEGDIAQMGF